MHICRQPFFARLSLPQMTAILWILIALLFSPGVQSSGLGASKAGIEIVLRNAVSGERLAEPAEFSEILIIRERRSIPVGPNMRLRPGDLISTGAFEAVITFDGDEKEIIVGRNSQIDILNPSIRAVIGEVIVKIKKGISEAADATRDLFRVEAQYVNAAAEGTIFYFRTIPEMTEVRVFEGRVRMETTAPGMGSLLLEAGDMASFRPNDKLLKRRMSRSQINEILVKVRRIERAVPPYSGRLIMPPPEAKPVAPKPPVITPMDTATTDRSELVRQAKRLLISLGQDPGPMNADENDSTASAVRAFKQSRNLPGPARIDEQLIEALRLEKKELDRRDPLPPVDRKSIKGIEASADEKIYGKGFMTADELIECIRQDQRTEAWEALLNESSEQLKARKKVLDASKAVLDQLYKKLNRSDQSAVDDYNDKVASHESLVEKFNKEEIEKHKEVLSSFTETSEACNKMCADRQFFIDDYLTARDTLRLKELHDSKCGL